MRGRMKRCHEELVNYSEQQGDSDSTSLARVIDTVDLQLGEKGHFFERAIGLLGIGHPLAYGSLSIAMTIDALILFCGFLGGKPQSYLEMSRPSDLSNALEPALRALGSVSDLPQGKQPHLRTYAALLEKLHSSVELSTLGYGGYLLSEELDEAKLQQLVGAWVAADLASPEKISEGCSVVALRTRLIIYMADQVYRGYMSDLTEETISKGSSAI